MTNLSEIPILFVRECMAIRLGGWIDLRLAHCQSYLQEIPAHTRWFGFPFAFLVELTGVSFLLEYNHELSNSPELEEEKNRSQLG